MNLVVAIETGLTEQIRRGDAGRQAPLILRQTWVAVLRMAALAQRWGAHTQHARVIRAVRIVTITTVFGDRRVLPKVGPARFRVTVVASVIERRAGQHSIRRVAMRAMTAAAIHFAVSYGMGIRLHRLRALLLVAIEADFRLCCRAEYRVPLDVAVVTVRAGNRVHVMFAAVPGRTGIAQVAVHAVGILFRHRRAGVRAE